MPIGAALAIASLAASAFGTAKSAQANRKADEQLAARQSELDAWYNKEYNQNYLDTDEAKSTVQILQNQTKEAMKKVDQNNAIRGASDETRVATADKLNTNLADNITRLAGYGTRYKDSMRREYQGLKSNLDNIDYQNLLNKSQNWSNLSSNAMNAAGGIIEADAAGSFDKWDEGIKNWWTNTKGARVKAPTLNESI